MFPGGSGDIGLGKNGVIRHDHNFVVRTRRLWNRQGYAVIIPDTINHINLRGKRSSATYASLIQSIIAFAHEEATVPVFLFGTSQGAIAAVNGTAHAASGTIAGVVLSESVSVMGGSKETVFSATPQKVTVPVLIVANQDDRCDVAPPQAAQQIASGMTASPEVRVFMVSGGITKSKKNCSSLTPHGYFGIENDVVDKVSAWLDAKSR
ncbi:alpha/beta hydrolase [Acetobacter pasteurianus]|uniref:Alpha/beta hydrolase n=1 Tax=Acetobacter pasteurianus NBRC 3188 TaxID=1226663 RepID=A0A401WYD8_ACEPA|nr:hypothetical protein NBRC3188_3023 [Acetobacter pasteurianus NBRC 3188]